METENIKITEIVPAEYNPRLISEKEYQDLQRSIENFGLVDPIIINLKNNRIIGGHQRYDILFDKYLEFGENENLLLIKLGDIGWAFPEDSLQVQSEDHEKALNIALNKITGDWDNPKLLTVLEGIDPDTFDVNLIGFSDDEKEIIEFRVKENDVDKYSTGKNKIESGENALFRIGKYKIKVPFKEYNEWKEEIINESVEKNHTIETLLIERLGLTEIIEGNFEKDELDEIEGDE